jgi:CubicO group peptidase (beta-lactamase class C family)
MTRALCLLGLAFVTNGLWADDAIEQGILAAVPEGFSGQIVIGDLQGVLFAAQFGLADREARVPVTADTLFDIGSVTKTFTATAILQLAAADKLTLEDTLGRWFDGLPDATAAITLNHLLSHRSGLPLYSGDDDAPCDRACFDTWLATTPLEFTPGERFQYSNPGYSALARVIEKAGGTDYETYLQDKLLTPLKIGPVGYLRLPDDARYAVGYFEGHRVGTPPELDWMDDGPSWHLRGNGGLITSATVLFRWLQATARVETLPARWHDLQFQRQSQRRPGVWYGYGWGILDRPWGEVIDHTGGNGFFFADARWIRDEGLLLAITDNAFDRDQIEALLDGIRAALGLIDAAPATSQTP